MEGGERTFLQGPRAIPEDNKSIGALKQGESAAVAVCAKRTLVSLCTSRTK